MRTSVTIVGSVALLTVGYVLGASQILSPGLLLAQAPKGKTDAGAVAPLSDETKAKIKAAADALKAAQEALQSDGRYESAIKSVNSFAVLAGGGNSVNDLKSSGGVDPETYAALFAGLATDAIVNDIGRDVEGKLTYKGRVVRMYPVSLIRSGYLRRADITGEDLLPTPVDESTKSKTKKKTDTPEETNEDDK